MYLFRALNNEDEFRLKCNDNIYSSLYYSYFNSNNSPKEQAELNNLYKKYFNTIYSNSLDAIFGHINGKKLDNQRSPWISTSNNFTFVATEYAVPQAGGYNQYTGRRPIAIIDFDSTKIFSTPENIKKIRNIVPKVQDQNFAIDLRNNNLQRLNHDNVLIPEKDQINAAYSFNREYYGVEEINGLDGYAQNADEIVIYKRINKEEIKEIMYPIMQDIVYATGILDNEYLGPKFLLSNYSFIENIAKEILKQKEESFLTTLYPSYKHGINLTDYLMDNYDYIYGNTIEEKYDYLKQAKKLSLNYIVNIINSILIFNGCKLDLKVEKLIDDKLYVKTYSNIDENINLYDLLLIEKDNKIYKYSSKTSKTQTYKAKDNKELVLDKEKNKIKRIK